NIMAASTEFSRGYVILEGGLSKDNASVGEDEILQNSDRLKQMGIRKPPRHISGVRHSMSSATLIPLTNPDEHICIDNLLEFIDGTECLPSPGGFYGVFDGHGGTDAATYVRQNILKFILEDSQFPVCLEKAIQNAFVKADHAFADNTSLDISSGTTALTALVFGRTVVVANAGDCRAVLGKREPELQQVLLTEDDEFLIIGCDGLWDVMSSQCAVSITRRELMAHNDPERCSRELVREALKRNTCDNLTVIVICFSVDPPLRIEEFGLGNISVKPVTDGKTAFLPVIRSGSCAEKGPKQYMEDEHICIDNLLEFIDGTECLPSPGGFYG
nr:probable protein phosphatase 2C 27 [Tanacetum cinerariifolium]